jgi:hypothetical protein
LFEYCPFEKIGIRKSVFPPLRWLFILNTLQLKFLRVGHTIKVECDTVYVHNDIFNYDYRSKNSMMLEI